MLYEIKEVPFFLIDGHLATETGDRIVQILGENPIRITNGGAYYYRVLVVE